MTKHIVVVAGNIGVGKTSLTERIGSRLGWWTGYESVTDNPYLADFYGDILLITSYPPTPRMIRLTPAAKKRISGNRKP